MRFPFAPAIHSAYASGHDDAATAPARRGRRRVLSAVAVALACCLALCACGADSPDAAVEAPRGDAAVVAEEIPAYDGALTIEINDGQPGFAEDESTPETAGRPFETYSRLDGLGRCDTAFALIGPETLPTEERGDISEIRPSGWKQARYDTVDQQALYNRSHLIAYQLAGENANERNLITGTRTMNAEGMLPYEELVGDYVRKTDNHVLYRVTPVFEGNELVARGVQMEALSVEDGGEAIRFNVFVYNIEPEIEIDYVTGESRLTGETAEVSSNELFNEGYEQGRENAGWAANHPEPAYEPGAGDEVHDYVLNTKSGKFHTPSCPSTDDIAPSNRQDYTGTRNDLSAQGYEPCGACRP